MKSKKNIVIKSRPMGLESLTNEIYVFEGS